MADWKENVQELTCDVVIVGAGPAGCCAALEAREHGHDVIVLDKADIKWSGSAGRGIDLIHSLGTLPTVENAIKNSQVSYSRYYREPDLANENVIFRLWEREEWALEKLMKFYNLKWYDGKMLWAGTGGAYAGASIRFNGLDLKPQLAAQVKKSGAKIMNRTMMVDVLTKDGKAVGVTAVGTREPDIYIIKAKAVVLATGSICRHFNPEMPTHTYKMKYHHCPSAITGDYVAAWRVGAELCNMDMNEGSVPHMDYTCITRGCLIGVRPLKIKEYTCDGEDLYTKNPNELSKKMFRTLDEMGKTPIYRGFDHIPDEMLKELEVNYIDEGFVNLKMCGEHGFDPKYHRFEVPRDKPYPPDASAVQMPGLAVDENFMTTVPGIFAIGDAVSCVGAVMSAIVTGYTVGDLMGTYLDSVTGEIEIDEAQAEKSVNIIKAPLEMDPETGVSPAEYECAIREYDERYIGIFKSKGKLEAGLRRLASLKREFADKIYASNAHYLMRALEARDIADMAEIIMTADMAREETRGFFNRADFQQMDPERTGKLTYIKNVDGKPVAEIKPAPKLKEELKNLPKLRVLFDENGDVVPDADVL